MRRRLIEAAKALAQGIEPPARDASMSFNDFRASEKILDPGENWWELGTEADPVMAQLQPLLSGARPFR
jgi:hypothetical protein